MMQKTLTDRQESDLGLTMILENEQCLNLIELNHT